MRVSTSRRQRDTLLKETQKRPLRTGTSHVREQETKDFSQPECLRADRRATNREGAATSPTSGEGHARARS